MQNVVTLYAATINGTVNNSPTNLLWNWGDGQQTTGFFPQSHTYSSGGTYTVQVTAQYSNGSSASSSENVTVTNPNTVTLYAATVSGLQATINGSVNNSPTNLVWNWGDGQQTTGFFPQSHTYSSAGTYTVQVTAHYSNGSSASASESVTIVAHVVTLYAPTVSGLQVQINGVATPGTSVTNINWNWGDGQQTAGFFPQIHTYSALGTYIVRVTAYYNDGFTASATNSVSLVAHVVTLYAPTVNGLQVQINGSAALGTSVTNISWNWGDGQQTTGFFPQTHTYSAAGTYTVQASAHYSDGATAPASETVSTSSSTVSSTLSQLFVTPGSALANGSNQITATVTLLDGGGKPVAGKTIIFWVNQSVPNPFFAPTFSTALVTLTTGSNGVATTEITSTYPGSGSLVAADVTDSVIVQNQPLVQFTGSFVSPNTTLAGSIQNLYQETANILDGTVGYTTTTTPQFSVSPIPWIAPDEGNVGDGFEKAAGMAKSAEITDAVFGFVGVATAGSGKIVEAVGQELISDTANAAADQVDWISKQNNGLSLQAQAIINVATANQTTLQSQKNTLNLVPQKSADITSIYTNDLQLRLYADYVLMTAMGQEDALLDNLQAPANTAAFDSDLVDVAEAGGAIVLIAVTAGAAAPVILLAEGG